ncbi:MAG: hypothetical protein AB1896_15940, partial [Thermodesulfobacteriota bacterium]
FSPAPNHPRPAGGGRPAPAAEGITTSMNPPSSAWNLKGWPAQAGKVGLKVRTEGAVFRLVLPYAVGYGEGALVLTGWAMILFGGGLYLYLLYAASIHQAVLAVLLLAGAGFGLLQVGAKTVGLEPGPDHCRFFIRYGFFLHRNIRIRPDRRLRFRGRVQSPWGVERWQKKPYYYLEVRRFLARRFILVCDGRQGDWITASLQAWNVSR